LNAGQSFITHIISNVSTGFDNRQEKWVFKEIDEAIGRD